MRLKTILAATAAITLAATPAMAQAASQSTRAGSPVSEAEDLRGGFLIPALAIIAIILGILAATGGGDDAPTSP